MGVEASRTSAECVTRLAESVSTQPITNPNRRVPLLVVVAKA
jgi:hypothetical protein